jgi:hypothetical protein
MRVLRLVQHPLAVLGLLSVAFGVWASWGQTPPSAGSHGPDLPASVPPKIIKKATFRRTDPSDRLSPLEVARALPKLHPGMMRAEVEELVGPPAPDDIQLVTLADGHVIFRTSYEVDLDALPAGQSARGRGPRPDRSAGSNDRTLVVLNFDSARRDYPLLSVEYPDPLF